MAQGKLKVKAKLPSNMKDKKKTKGPAASQRTNKPIQSKKHKIQESQKLKKMVSKSVNRTVEDEMRSRASSGKKTFSKVQQAVAAHNTAASSSSK